MKLWKVEFEDYDNVKNSHIVVANSRREALQKVSHSLEDGHYYCFAYEIKEVNGYEVKLVKINTQLN